MPHTPSDQVIVTVWSGWATASVISNSVTALSRVIRPAVMPPSMTSSDPVMWLDMSEARNRMPLAISSASPALPSGTVVSATA